MKEVLSREVPRVPALRGTTIVTLFYENSTRTRASFELAGKVLGADVINVSASGSSVVEGRVAHRYREDAAGRRRRRAHHAPQPLRRAVPRGAPRELQRHQRRRRPARASDAGAARPLHDAQRASATCAASGRHRRRHPAQPRRALEHVVADDARRRGRRLRAADAAARAASADAHRRTVCRPCASRRTSTARSKARTS